MLLPAMSPGGLGVFTDRYLTELTANGVWISGFFGSGKSHLLKILSLILDGQPLASGVRPSDIVLPKIEDEIVKANLRKATAIPSRSILFNIDQKFDGIGGDHSAPILEVFVKVLNELQGYYGKQGYIARFEHDLDVRGDFIPFKEDLPQDQWCHLGERPRGHSHSSESCLCQSLRRAFRRGRDRGIIPDAPSS
jgi:hypothetical protein